MRLVEAAGGTARYVLADVTWEDAVAGAGSPLPAECE